MLGVTVKLDRVLADLGEFRKLCLGISVHKQSSLLDTIFKYMFYVGPPGKYLSLSVKIRLSIYGEAGNG